jgi:hypothetical protein
MAKSFKKFREEWEDDEWGLNDEDDVRSKEHRMKNRRNKRKNKVQEKYSSFDNIDDNDG